MPAEELCRLRSRARTNARRVANSDRLGRSRSDCGATRCWLRAVCRFVRHVQVEDVGHKLPPANHFGARKRRRTPHIYTTDEIGRLIEAALRLRPMGGLRPYTYSTLIALLSATGLRISEALKLTIADVTSDGLLIRETSSARRGWCRCTTRRSPACSDTWTVAGPARTMIRCSSTSAVGPLATLPSRRPSTGWSTRPASSRGRDIALACTIPAHGCHAVRCRGGPSRPRPVRGARGGTRDLHGPRQRLATYYWYPEHTGRLLWRCRRRRTPRGVRGRSTSTPGLPHRDVPAQHPHSPSEGPRHTSNSYASSFQLTRIRRRPP